MNRRFALHPLLRLFLWALLVLAPLAVPLHAADVVYPTGSRIGLVPPTGMMASERFPGFEDKATGATILLLDVPEKAYADAAKQISKDVLQDQRIVEEKRENFPAAGDKTTLVVGRQEGERKARKWFLLASQPAVTALVVVEIPTAAKDRYSDESVRTMLASLATRDSIPLDEQLSLLPLRFEDMSGMRPVRVIGNIGAIFTSGPKDTLEPSEQPMLIVSVGRGGPEEQSARDMFARNLLAGVGNLKDVRITGIDTLRLGGGNLRTHQLFAEGKDAKTDAPIKIVQWIRFGSGAFLRFVGVARADTWSEAFPHFRAVRDGVNPRG